jgi:membrane peptidoglycan carboxypeptidase
MIELNWITQKEKDDALKEEIKLGKIRSFQGSALPYVTNTVAQELRKKFGQEALLKGGMRVQTTVDAKFQAMAEEAPLRVVLMMGAGKMSTYTLHAMVAWINRDYLGALRWYLRGVFAPKA